MAAKERVHEEGSSLNSASLWQNYEAKLENSTEISVRNESSKVHVYSSIWLFLCSPAVRNAVRIAQRFIVLSTGALRTN